MSNFLIGVGCAASFDGVEYVADDAGVIAIPDAMDLVAINVQGLTKYIEAPAAEAPSRGPGRPRRVVAEEVPAEAHVEAPAAEAA